MPVYNIDGEPISADGNAVTVKRNDLSMVDDFLSVARSYLGQTGMNYSDGNTIFYTDQPTTGIDCSTYAMLCMMGYSYEESPYYTKQYKNPDSWEANTLHNWGISPIQYKISRYIDGSSPTESIHLACQIARWMTERSQVVPLGNGFRDVLPGDVVFWAIKKRVSNEWWNPTWYLHISHIGLILSKEDAPDTYEVDGTTYTWDKSKYPFKHTIIEVYQEQAGGSPCQNNRWLELRQEDPTNVYGNNVNTIAMIARPDLGALRQLTTN